MAGEGEGAGIAWARKVKEDFSEKVICGFLSQWWNCVVNSTGQNIFITDDLILKQIILNAKF